MSSGYLLEITDNVCRICEVDHGAYTQKDVLSAQL